MLTSDFLLTSIASRLHLSGKFPCDSCTLSTLVCAHGLVQYIACTESACLDLYHFVVFCIWVQCHNATMPHAALSVDNTTVD